MLKEIILGKSKKLPIIVKISYQRKKKEFPVSEIMTKIPVTGKIYEIMLKEIMLKEKLIKFPSQEEFVKFLSQ